MLNAICLLNPHAAGGRCAALREPLQQALQQTPGRSAPVPLIVPQDVPSARAQLAALPRGSRVIVAGGDGTVHQLLPALLAGGHELALLPGGTGNDLARALGLAGLGWREALAHALAAPARPMDLGELVADNGAPQVFMSSLCAGFDAAIGARALRAPAWLRGMPRYLWATLAEIHQLRNYPMRLRVDGQTLPGGELLFASSLNTPSYASGMPVAPGARMDDGLLRLVRVGRFGRLGALAAMPLLLSGQHLRHPRISLQTFRTLEMLGETPLPLALDGEPVPSACALAVRVRPGALAMVARRPGR